jgi:hypothetical protein
MVCLFRFFIPVANLTLRVVGIALLAASVTLVLAESDFHD